MQRRTFLGASLAGAAALPLDGRTSAAGAADSTPSSAPLLAGAPVLAGPAADALTVLQPIGRPATGFVELRVDDGPWSRIDAETAGLLPFERHVLKFRLPAQPPGATLHYRVTVRAVDFQNAYKIVLGDAVVTPERSFRTLDPAAEETRFVVWNDTHENLETLRALQARTAELRPDFVVWNGDQTNDVYDESKMAGQYLAPGELAIAADRPLAYARGNHDVRGPAARHVARFTGTPDDRFYYAFRSGPLAALVMDTGEDKPDDHPVFAGLAGFAAFRRRQTEWLAETIRRPWFQSAPFKVLFCHIPLWWKDEATDRGYWMFSPVCRDAWLPHLTAGGVRLVVSGHTHEATWLPPAEGRPIGQLIGGGPKPSAATIIVGRAAPQGLEVELQTLDGRTLQRLAV